MNVWRPIHTAPKDGTEFLGYDASSSKMDVCSWDGRQFWQVQFDGENGPLSDEFGYRPERISHWTPLPDAPRNERVAP